MAKVMTEQYGTSPLTKALEDIRRVNEADEAVRVAARAAFCKEKMRRDGIDCFSETPHPPERV